jgi:hypothetical protein
MEMKRLVIPSMRMTCVSTHEEEEEIRNTTPTEALAEKMDSDKVVGEPQNREYSQIFLNDGKKMIAEFDE